MPVMAYLCFPGLTSHFWTWQGKASRSYSKRSQRTPVGGIGHIETSAYDAYTDRKLLVMGEIMGDVFRADRALLRTFFMQTNHSERMHFNAKLNKVGKLDDGRPDINIRGLELLINH